MKVSGRVPHPGSEGSLGLTPEVDEDVWHMYNLIAAGDTVSAVTVRKVTRERSSGAGPAESERVRVKLSIVVESCEYDGEACEVRCRGKICNETEHARLGSYHTLTLGLRTRADVAKPAWDAADAERLKAAADPAASADLAALLVTEGLAHVVLVGAHVTSCRARVETHLPRKTGAAAAGYAGALDRFYSRALEAVGRHVDFTKVTCLVVAGPGFAPRGFVEYAEREARRGAPELRFVLEHFPGKVVVCRASSAHRHALREVLEDPAVAPRIKDTQAARETAALEEFYSMLGRDPARAMYGPGHVAAAHYDRLAVQTLLVSDALFRARDAATRSAYVDLVQGVRDGGGRALVFSAAHPSGEQLGQLGGVAALLRFPLPDLDEADPDELMERYKLPALDIHAH